MSHAGVGQAIFTFGLNLFLQYSIQIFWCMMNTI